MAVSRGQTPPVNLKERIAALQQRSVSPNTHPSAQTIRGLPSPGTGGLRDKIAKFESKGGVPVPRGNFAMGAPPLTENAPHKKRGELNGNRVPGLGRPSGQPVGSCPGSPLPPASDAGDANPGPRKRCISTGATLSSSSSSLGNLQCDEPVPPLPNGLSSSARRNSLDVDFGSERRVMSEGSPLEFVDDAPCIPDTPAETESRSPSPQEVVVETGPLEEEPSSAEVLSEPLPVVQESSQADSHSSGPEVHADTPVEDPPPHDQPVPVSDVSAPLAVKQTNGDDHSDDETAPQPADSQPSLLVMSSEPSDTPSPPTIPHPTETTSLSTPHPQQEAEQATTCAITVSAPTPSMPAPATFETSSPVAETKSTFKAVVHRKVTEAAASSLAPPAAPQLSDQRRSVSSKGAELPSSPGHGDLALLLEDAALLEFRLAVGNDTGSRAKQPLATTPSTESFQQDARHASATTLTEHAHMPSIDSGSQSAGSVSIPSIREPSADGEIPEGDETDGRSLASTTFSQRSPSHRKYLSNIYRLTNRRSSSYMPGAYPRDSMSLSSEDSSPVTTPSSDNGKRKGFGIAWPSSSSPKNKSGPNVGRSSSFADKIFNRNRTRSNVSAATDADPVAERTSLYESSQPSLSLSLPSDSEHPDVDVSNTVVVRQATWISPGEGEFSPASSLLDKDIFDAFPSVPQTLPPGFCLDAENAGGVGRTSTLPINGRKQVNQRLSMK